MDQQQQVNETTAQLLKQLFDGSCTPEELQLSQATQGQEFNESIYGQAIKDALEVYNAQ